MVSVCLPWCPLATPTVLLGFLLPWTWGIFSRLLQQSAGPAPYFGRGVSAHHHPSWPWMWNGSCRPSCARAAISLDELNSGFYQTLKEVFILILCNFFQRTEAKGIISHSSCEVSITLYQKPDKDKIRKLQTNISHKCGCKDSQWNLSKPNPTMYKKNYITWPRGIYLRHTKHFKHIWWWEIR